MMIGGSEEGREKDKTYLLTTSASPITQRCRFGLVMATAEMDRCR